MKNKIKGLLAIALSAACFLSTTPLAGFAAGKQTITVGEGTFSASDSDGNTVTELSVIEGDEITSDENGKFFVTVNGEKITEGYGENSYEGYAENNAEAEKSGNTYYDKFTVPATPKGYKNGAVLTVKQNSDYFIQNENFKLGNTVNLEYVPISYKVIFDSNGGEGNVDAVETKYDTEFTLPDSDSFSKESFKFTGWNTISDGSGTSYTASETVKNLTDKDGSEIVLYAIPRISKRVQVFFFGIARQLCHRLRLHERFTAREGDTADQFLCIYLFFEPIDGNGFSAVRVMCLRIVATCAMMFTALCKNNESHTGAVNDTFFYQSCQLYIHRISSCLSSEKPPLRGGFFFYLIILHRRHA